MDMKKILQAMDGISTKPVEGVDSMSKFLSVVTEAERVTDLGDGQKRIDYDDGTYDIQDGTGTTTYDSKGTALKHAGPNFGAQLTRDYTNGTQTRSMQKGPLSIKQTADTGGNVIQTDAEADVGSEKLSATFPAKHKTVPKMFQENDLSKFLSVVDKNDVSILSEGANPHKVTLPVQMAMQHYQKPQKSIVRKDRLIDKYFTEAETAITQRKEAKRAKINQYASIIAERVLMKESKTDSQSVNELSTELLGKYKKAAGADAKKADAAGDYARGDKRFKGINKATNKQFDNDAKKYEGYDGPNDAAQFAKPPPVPQVPPEDGIYGSWEFTTRKDGDRSATGPAGTFVWDNSGAGGALRPITWSLPSNILPGMSWVTDFVSGTHTLAHTLKLDASDLELNTKIHTKLDGTNPGGSVGLKYRGHEATFTSANGKATGTYKDPDGKETSWDVPPEPAGEVKQEGLDQLLALRNKIDEAIKQRLDPKCWKGKHKEGTKIKGGVRVNNCVPNKK